MSKMGSYKRKKTKVRITIENRGGKLVRVTTTLGRKARDVEEFVEPYNPLAAMGIVVGQVKK